MRLNALKLAGVMAGVVAVFGSPFAAPRLQAGNLAPVPEARLEPHPREAPHLPAYADEAALQAALGRWQQASRRRDAERRQAAGLAMSAAPTMAAAAPAPAAPANAAVAEGTAASADSITNVQTAGVDEGGIVKRAGDHLVILRRGRLFTVRVGGDALVPVAAIDAYAPGADPRGAWYDELLISGSTVIVIGYSYARGGTEIGLFELGRQGGLQYRATYHLRSFDYYSARNYASRLVGRKLVFYTPTVLHPWGPPVAQMMPALRRYTGNAAVPGEFERILPATRIHRTDDEFEPDAPLALHTVTQCDIDAAALRCEASAVLGPPGRVFYVSQGSVYVWTHQVAPRWRQQAAAPSAPGGAPVAPASAVFRLPMTGAAPTAIKTAGVPTDQMSFLEDTGGHLNVLVRDSGAGDAMWASAPGRGQVALLRLPLGELGDGRSAARRERYLRLPDVPGGALHNRYVGDWLVWGAGQAAWALRYAAGGHAPVATRTATPVGLPLAHELERIEALGTHAVLVGNAGHELNFSALRLGPAVAELADRHVVAGARQGESRSHGFFYKPLAADEGLLGLPLLAAGGTRHGAGAVFAGGQGTASVLFLRQRDLRFAPAGELHAARELPRDDGCKASCVDWYGNARPIFLGERVFALMGYEIVEGSALARGGAGPIAERRRINLASVLAAARQGRPTPFG
ncbi:MAG: beta-propeller domain-containing protein [Rubrivivax sp.]|nr:beta-propeller domain-containing protein [Rubrivivax sp.]